MIIGKLLGEYPLYKSKGWEKAGLFIVLLQIVGAIFILPPSLTMLDAATEDVESNTEEKKSLKDEIFVNW